MRTIEFRLIPVEKLPKRITGRPRKRIDPYDFKGRFSIDILKIRQRGRKYRP